MNREQVKHLIKAVKTSVMMFEATEQGHYLAQAENGLKELRKWKLKQVLNDNNFKIEKERMQWILS